MASKTYIKEHVRSLCLTRAKAPKKPAGLEVNYIQRMQCLSGLANGGLANSEKATGLSRTSRAVDALKSSIVHLWRQLSTLIRAWQAGNRQSSSVSEQYSIRSLFNFAFNFWCSSKTRPTPLHRQQTIFWIQKNYRKLFFF